MNADKPFLGILLMVGFCMLAPMGDAIAKFLGGTVPLAELLWARFTVQAIVLILYARAAGISLTLSRRAFRLTVVRTVLHMIGIGAMFLSLRYLPLANALAIAFVMPFLMLLLGRFYLGEEVGPRRLVACAIGFAGTLLVIQPSFADVGWPALLPLVVAVAFAFFMLITRAIAKDVDPIGLQAVSGTIAAGILSVAYIVNLGIGWAPLEPLLPTVADSLLMVGIGILGTVAHLMMTWSLRFAPSATVAPVQYLEIAFGTLVGFIVFGDLPNLMAAAGMVVIVGAGLYVVYRERAISRTLAADTTTI